MILRQIERPVSGETGFFDIIMLRKSMLRKSFWICLFVVFFIIFGSTAMADGFLDEKDEYIIVIDPGHGGDNAGTISNPAFEEKEITMKTAMALVEELSKYQGVEVYLTHEDDVDLSLKERAVFAEKKKADFLFSIHYNASEYHTMFGTEVWIPLKAPYHAVGYQFAYLQQLEMQELGLFSRGIKTRANDKGTDYYGIIRECVAREIPAVIIEHCYVDEARDSAYVDSDADFEEFGRRDAIAIAKFLGLEPCEEIPELTKLTEDAIVAHTYEDKTSPGQIRIETDKPDYENCLLTITVNGYEEDTALMYYDYSIDGGKTYSKLYPWPHSNMLLNIYDDYFALTFDIPEGSQPEIILRAYNKFDLYTESNVLSGFDTFQPSGDESVVAATKAPADTMGESQSVSVSEKQEVSGINSKRLLLLMAFVLLWILLLVSVVYMIYSFFGKGKRHK